MNKQNKCNYRMHAIIIKILYKKLSLMECLNGPTWVPNELSVLNELP